MTDSRIAVDPINTCDHCHLRIGGGHTHKKMICSITREGIPVKFIVNYDGTRSRAIPDWCPLPTYNEINAIIKERIGRDYIWYVSSEGADSFGRGRKRR